MRLPPFKSQGSIHLDRKKSAAGLPIESLGPSPLMSYSLRQRQGHIAVPRVSPGDHVLRGTVIAGGRGALDPPIHASTSGTVRAFLEAPFAHPQGRSALTVEIESDGLDRATPPLDPLSIRDLDRTRLIRRLQEAGIVGLGGGAFPTAHKASNETPLHTLIVNGVECEPYVSGDDQLIRERAQEILEGAEILARVLGIQNILVAIDEHLLDALAAVHQALKAFPREGFRLSRVEGRYPGGGERQLIERLTGREVPSGEIPQTIGVICQNVGTLFNLGRAITQGEILTSRVLTVGGECIRTPKNLEVRLGTPIQDVILYCGGLLAPNALLWHGGPMMGFEIKDSLSPVTPRTHAILAFEAPARPPLPEPCIRCGACNDACPAYLLPEALYRASRSAQLETLVTLHVGDCIECGACNVVCPSHLPLVETFLFSKEQQARVLQERERAHHARQRYEARISRLERQEMERERIRLERKVALEKNSSPKILEAIERARRKQQSMIAAMPKESSDDELN